MVTSTTTKKAAAKPPAKKTSAVKKTAAGENKGHTASPTKKTAASTGAAAATRKTAGAGRSSAPAVDVQAPEYVADYPVSKMKAHPENPRRHTVADSEMVASIQEHGLLQAIVLGPDGVVVMGNRRRDGLVKAKKKTAPALIRHDLDTPEKQLEAALVENLHREDMTPVEEAEAFEALRGMGYTQAKIATKTGRPVATVRDRLKLIKLSSKTKDALHQGQLSITDALAMVEFADDPKVTKKLDDVAQRGSGLQYAIQQARDAKTRAAAIAKGVAEAEKAGVPQAAWPDKTSQEYELHGKDGGPALLSYTFSQDHADHPDCLAYLTPKSTWDNRLIYVCTKPKSHADQVSDAEKARRAEREKADAERAERQKAEEISATLRTTSVAQLVEGGIGLHPRLRDLVRALLPSMVWDLWGDRLKSYQRMMAVPDNRRWTGHNVYSRTTADTEAFAEHVRDLGEGSDFTLTTAVVALIVGAAEDDLDEVSYGGSAIAARRYFEFLEGIGHDFTDVDNELRADADGTTPEEEPAGDDSGLDDDELEPHPHVGADDYACVDCGLPAGAEVHTIADGPAGPAAVTSTAASAFTHARGSRFAAEKKTACGVLINDDVAVSRDEDEVDCQDCIEVVG